MTSPTTITFHSSQIQDNPTYNPPKEIIILLQQALAETAKSLLRLHRQIVLNFGVVLLDVGRSATITRQFEKLELSCTSKSVEYLTRNNRFISQATNDSMAYSKTYNATYNLHDLSIYIKKMFDERTVKKFSRDEAMKLVSELFALLPKKFSCEYSLIDSEELKPALLSPLILAVIYNECAKTMLASLELMPNVRLTSILKSSLSTIDVPNHVLEDFNAVSIEDLYKNRY